MIEQLIYALHAKELHPTAEEIADLLWLAEQMGAPTYDQAANFARQNAQSAQVETAHGDEPWEHDDKGSNQPPPDVQREADQQPGADVQLPPAPEDEDGAEGPGGLPFRSPGSPALPGTLALARALRHLKRRVSSRTQRLLDEEATVRHIVDTDDWSPVQKAAPARWLDVMLVIDESSSMVVWEQLISEFHQLLERQGAFRTVRRWYMATDAALTKTALYAERGGVTRNAPRRNASELLDPQGQRLILVISDCVSAGWYDGTVAEMLKGWSDKGMVALIQMLPQSMWLRTALRSGSQLYLRSSQPGMVNARLEQHIPRRRRRQREANDPKPEGVVLPVVTLEAEQLLPWAKLVAGANVQWTPGVVLPLTPALEQETDLVAQPPLTAEERVKRFFATASPAAQALAGYLSTVPLSLGVMRLVQRAMFKEGSRQVHLAEVLLSGLVEQRRQVTYAKSDDIHYEFFPGVRERLQDTVLESDAVRVLEEVSNFVNTHTGQPIDFRALLKNPALAGEIAWKEGTQRFAVVAAEVLRRFGGRYAELAKVLEPASFTSLSLKFDMEQASTAEPGSIDEALALEQNENEKIKISNFKYSASPRVLVVDNDEKICQFLSLALTNRHYEVQVAEGFGTQLIDNAVILAQRFRPHVAIIDLRLIDNHIDEMSGLELLPFLQSARCILYSSYLGTAATRKAARQYNVFAWVDKYEIEALFKAVKEAAEEASAVARPIQVDWPQSWPLTQIVEKLLNTPDRAPGDASILEDMIAQLFPNNQHFTAEVIAGSERSVGSFQRGRSIVTKIYADNFEPKVLKLASAEATRAEGKNYEAYIQNWMPGLHATRLEQSATFWDLGGTIYSFMGANGRVLPTFAQHYAAKDDIERIVQPLQRFFTQIWQPHYANAAPCNESLFSTYDKHFRLSSRWQRIEEELLLGLRHKLGMPLVNPVAWVQRNEGASWFPTVRHAVTHGDLHGDNLFIEGEQAWIIDFERTGLSHALRDFAELEVDIYTRLADSFLEWDTLYELTTILVAAPQPDSFLQPTLMLSMHPEATKALAVIQAVRQLAATVAPYEDQREYLWALRLDALYVASVRSIDRRQRQRAILFASMISERLSTWDT